MRHTVVRYTVKPGSEEENEELVRAVYRELAELRPEGFRYATYRLEDGRTFVHVAEQDGDGDGPLPGWRRSASSRRGSTSAASRSRW